MWPNWHLTAGLTAQITNLDTVVGGKLCQVAVANQQCNFLEVTVEGSLAKSAGEAWPAHKRRTRKQITP